MPSLTATQPKSVTKKIVAAAPKARDCICKICKCGKHRCHGSGHSNIASLGGGKDAHMNSVTENREQFKKHEMPEHKLVILI